MHCAEEQLEKEGVTWTFPILLGSNILAGNALTNIGGTTPYVTRFGSTPAMMPDLDASQEDGEPGKGRSLQRIRMVSLQKTLGPGKQSIRVTKPDSGQKDSKIEKNQGNL